MQKKLVFQEPVFIHLAAVKCPHEVCTRPPPTSGAGYKASWGTDPTRWAAERLLGARTVLSPNLAPRTHRDLPGRYTAEGRQVALPLPSHSSDCSASRAPPGLKPQTARVAGAGSVLPSTPRGRLPALETRAPATGLGLQGKLTVVATGLRTQPAGDLASVTRREPTKDVLCSRKRWRSPGRKERREERRERPRWWLPGRLRRQLTSVSRSAATDLAPRPGQASAGARLARGE